VLPKFSKLHPGILQLAGVERGREILFILRPKVKRTERSVKNYWRILIYRKIRTSGRHNIKEVKRAERI
jgi:hypothetical protein